MLSYLSAFSLVAHGAEKVCIPLHILEIQHHLSSSRVKSQNWVREFSREVGLGEKVLVAYCFFRGLICPSFSGYFGTDTGCCTAHDWSIT